MRRAKRIKIIQGDPDYWYCALAGCVFSVTGETSEAYHVAVGGVRNNYSVGKSHAKVVEWAKPTKDEWRPCISFEERIVFVKEIVVKNHDHEDANMITGVYDGGFNLGEDFHSDETMLWDYKLLDGSPIGVKL